MGINICGEQIALAIMGVFTLRLVPVGNGFQRFQFARREAKKAGFSAGFKTLLKHF